MDSVIITVEKKRGAQDCVDFRTISLVSRVSKIVLKILTFFKSNIPILFSRHHMPGILAFTVKALAIMTSDVFLLYGNS